MMSDLIYSEINLNKFRKVLIKKLIFNIKYKNKNIKIYLRYSIIENYLLFFIILIVFKI